MDSAIKTNRKYPSYTTAQLEAFVAEGRGNDVMVQEIADRKSGVSKTLHQRFAEADAKAKAAR